MKRFILWIAAKIQNLYKARWIDLKPDAVIVTMYGKFYIKHWSLTRGYDGDTVRMEYTSQVKSPEIWER